VSPPCTRLSHDHDYFHALVYLCYLIFQLFSHKNIYDDHHLDVQPSVAYHPDVARRLRFRRKNPAPSSPLQSNDATDAEDPQRDVRSVEAGPIEEDEEEVPQMSIRTTIALLVVVTVVCRWSILLTVPRAESAE
jgi:Ca2+:H+ antiporter